MVRVELDRAACDGVFACLVRDPRFTEDDEGLATLPDATLEGDTLVAELDDRDSLEEAAAACPFDAISVGDAE